jgi:hypothetical protein
VPGPEVIETATSFYFRQTIRAQLVARGPPGALPLQPVGSREWWWLLWPQPPGAQLPVVHAVFVTPGLHGGLPPTPRHKFPSPNQIPRLVRPIQRSRLLPRRHERLNGYVLPPQPPWQRGGQRRRLRALSTRHPRAARRCGLAAFLLVAASATPQRLANPGSSSRAHRPTPEPLLSTKRQAP